MKHTKTYISSASSIESESPMGIASKFIGEYHGGTASKFIGEYHGGTVWSGGELNDGRSYQKLEYMAPIALDKKLLQI